MKKLNVDGGLISSLHEFYESISPLEKKIAGILWQFPSNFPYDYKRIEKFSRHLKKEIPNFFEFRKSEWYKKETAEFLNDLGLGICTISAPGFHYEQVFKSSHWVYLRLHGKYNWYDYEYSKDELIEYREQVRKADPELVFIFFNNDIGARAPLNAKQMKGLF
jgi:uncharacterized protein YecE (DUF72 family)